MSLAADLARTCFEILREYGAPGTLTRNVDASYDPATTSGVAGPVAHAIQAAVFDYDLKMIDGSKVLEGDKNAIVAARANTVPTPQPGDKVVWSPTGVPAETYYVMSAKRIGIAGVNICYDIQLRGGATS